MSQQKKKSVTIKDIDTGLLECRDLQHSWVHSTDFQIQRIDRRIASVRRVLQCTRCGAMRTDHYELPSFHRISSSYVYPEGYLIPGHKGRILVAEVRQEILKRWMKEVK